MISPTVPPDTTTLSSPAVRLCSSEGIHTTATVPTLWPALPSSLAPETWGCGADARQWLYKWHWQWRLLAAQWVLLPPRARQMDALDWALPPGWCRSSAGPGLWASDNRGSWRWP